MGELVPEWNCKLAGKAVRLAIMVMKGIIRAFDNQQCI